MKKILMMAVAAGVLMSPTLVIADDYKGGGKHKERMEALKNMSPEERKAHMEAKRAEWEAMSPEERDAKRADHKAKREARKAEMDAKYETLSAEEKAKVDAKRAERRAKHEDMKERRAEKKESRQNWNLND